MKDECYLKDINIEVSEQEIPGNIQGIFKKLFTQE